MKAKDIMIPLNDILRPTDTIKDAVNLLRTAKISDDRVSIKGLPVIDQGDKLVGIVSMGDILRVARPTYLDFTDISHFTWDQMAETLAKKAGNKLIKEIMTKEVKTVREDASLMECIDIILKYRVGRLPVLDKKGKPVGMLYERDVFFGIAKAMLDN